MEHVEQTWQWLSEPLIALGQRLAELAPNLVGALMLLIAGYILSKVAGWAVRGLLVRIGVDKLAEKSGLETFLRHAGISQPPSAVLGGIAFVFVLLAFAISAADPLGLAAASSAVSQIMLFLPKFVAAIAVLVLGLVVANWLSNLARAAADNAGLEYASTVQRITMALFAALVILLAVDQLEIRIFLLYEVILVVLAAMGIALALSLGLGTRTLSGEIVSGVDIRDLLAEGERIEWNGVTARVLEGGAGKTSLRLSDGRTMLVANSVLAADKFILDRS